MKAWIKTKIVGDGTEHNPKRPYLPLELPYSMIELDANTCLARVSGMPNPIQPVLADVEIEEITDADARVIIKSKYPHADLENIDVADIELDEIARAEGLNPDEVRKKIRVATRGKQILQCQEMHLMRVLAAKRGVDLADLEEHIELGYNHAHNQALARLRGSSGI